LLIAIAIIGVAAAATLELGSILQRRAAEEELLAIGSEFRRALISYASATPAGQPTAPPTLEALLKDPRYPNIRRHLRKLYYDPMTGSQQWGIVKTIDGNGIAGIYSLSTAKPIKIGNFETQFLSLADKTSYSQWVFMAVMPIVPQQNSSDAIVNNGNNASNMTAPAQQQQQIIQH
jgi:type II secretory pathway pseudopilin PulG